MCTECKEDEMSGDYDPIFFYRESFVSGERQVERECISLRIKIKV